jgi:hypothetical protein
MSDDTTNCLCRFPSHRPHRGTWRIAALLVGMSAAAPAAIAAIQPVGVSGGAGVYAGGFVGLDSLGTASRATELGTASATADTSPLPRVSITANSTLPSIGWGASNETNAAASMGYSVLVPGTPDMNFDLLVTASGSVTHGGTGAGGGSLYGASAARFAITVVGTNALIVARDVCVGYTSSPIPPGAPCNSQAGADTFALDAFRFTVKGNTELRVGLSTIAAATDNGTASAAVDPFIQIAPDSPYAGEYTLQFSPGITQSPQAVPNYQGLWWNPSESGWGINFAHQGNILFATWFTYDAAGKPLWMIAQLEKNASGAYSGPVSTVTGAPFDGVPFDSAKVVETVVGSATVTFAAADRATFAYMVNGKAQTKAIVPQEFPRRPTCAWGALSDLRSASNFTDLWWNSAESGWGINFSHQGDIIFATWFTYDGAGKPWWLIAQLEKTGNGTYAGPVSTVVGSAWDSSPFDASKVVETVVGSATATFANGNSASLAYTVNGISQTKAITRQVFVPPGTVCQ